MMRNTLAIFAGALLGSAATAAPTASLDIGSALAGDATGFEQALAVRPFIFPADHASHPSFRNEWWYLTGQLEDEEGQHYGFQYTLFRVGLTPPQNKQATWPRDTLWMAHAALSDSGKKQQWHVQRLSHGGVETAGASAAPFRAWLDNWRLSSTGEQAQFPWALSLQAEDFHLELSLNTDKPVVLQGDRGLSHKGGAGNASYYYSYTDLAASGTLDGKPVSGRAWFDREWSTSVLPDGVLGWDWFSLQLDDGRQLMLYQLRGADSLTTANSRSGTLIAADGSSRQLFASDISMQALEHWQSPMSKANYPISWQLDIQGLEAGLKVRANFAEQELLGIVNYWEGAITLSSDDGSVQGRGYLEMTGYASTRDSD